MGKYAQGDEPLPGYRLRHFIGQGGFGEVWKAQGPGGIEAAMKFIGLSGTTGRKEFGALHLMKRIHHPNLVPMFGAWFVDENRQIIQETPADLGVGSQVSPPGDETLTPPNTGNSIKPVELIVVMGLGEKNLTDRLRECLARGERGIPLDELFDYLEGAAKAIDFLNTPKHDLGSGLVAIQHCDIKPLNLLIVGDACQVCDFGLARALDQNNLRATAMSGSPAYLAPECIEGKTPCATTDQYSLAITYYELRCGALPFNNPDSMMAVFNAHLQGELNFSRVSQAEIDILRRATSLNPGDRFGKCVEMMRALRQATKAGSLPSSDAPEPTSDAPVKTLHSIPEHTIHVGLKSQFDPARTPQGAEMTSIFELPKTPTVRNTEMLDSAASIGATISEAQRIQQTPRNSAADTAERVLKLNESKTPTESAPGDDPQTISWKRPRTLGRRLPVMAALGFVVAAALAAVVTYQLSARHERSLRELIATEQFDAAAKEMLLNDSWLRQWEDRPALRDELWTSWAKWSNAAREDGRPREVLQRAHDELSVWAAYDEKARHLHDELAMFLRNAVPPEGTTESSKPPALPTNRQLLETANLLRCSTKESDRDEAQRLVNFLLESTNKLEPPGLQFDAQLIRGAVNALGDMRPFDPGATTDLAALYAGLTPAEQEARRALWTGVLLVDHGYDGPLADGKKFDAAAESRLNDVLDRHTEYRTALSKSTPANPYSPSPLEQQKIAAAMDKLLPAAALDTIRQSALAADRTSDSAAAMIARLVSFRPDFESLVAEAVLQLRKDDLAESRRSLDQAKTMSGTPVQSYLVESGRDLLAAVSEFAQEPVAPAKVVAAVDQLAQKREDLRRLSPEIADYVVRRLVDQAVNVAEPNALFRVAAIMKQAAPTDSFPAGAGEKVRSALLVRVDGQIEAPKRDLLQVNSLMSACRDANLSEPHVQALLVESILEAGPAALAVLDAKQRDAALASVNDPTFAEATATDDYVAYVRGLAAHERGLDTTARLAACDLLAAALKVRPSARLNERRLTRACELLFGEVELMKIKPTGREPAWWLPTFVDDAPAEKVCDWMRTVFERQGIAPSDAVKARVLFALATAQTSSPDTKLALLALTNVLNDDTAGQWLSPDRRLVLKLGTARFQPDDDAGRAAAVRSYADVTQQIVSTKRISASEGMALYERVVLPGIQAADRIAAEQLKAAELRSSLATLHAAQGKLLKEVSQVERDLRGDQRAQRMTDAYQKAVDYDSKSARNFIGYGGALLEFSTPRLSEAAAASAQAVELDADSPAAQILYGTVRLYQGRTADPAARPAEFEAAIAAYKKAVELAKKQADDAQLLESAYIAMSTAHTELANYSAPDPSELKQRLDQAVEYGRLAAELQGAYLDYAYRAQGNALEDLAWLAGEKEKYRDALAMFSREIETAPQSAVALCNRARCRIKMIEELPALNATDVKAIDDDLSRASSADPTWYETERWKAELLFLQALRGPLDESKITLFKNGLASLGQALQVAEKQGRVHEANGYRAIEVQEKAQWYAHGTNFGDELILRVQANPTPDAIVAARTSGVLLKDVNAEAAAGVAARLSEIEKNWDGALKEYAAVLPTDLGQTEAKHIKLLLYRGQCRLQMPHDFNEVGLKVLDDAVNDTQRAADLALREELPKYRFEALAAAGMAHSYRYRITPTDDDLSRALTAFGSAAGMARLDGKLNETDVHGFIWRSTYAQLLLRKYETEKKPGLLDEAAESLLAARRTDNTAQQNTLLDRLEGVVEKQRSN